MPKVYNGDLTKLFDLTGKKAVIFGGAGGFGQAIAEGYAANGCSVCISSRSEEKLQAAKAAIIENLQQLILGWVTDAEHDLGGGTGKLKASKVAALIYKYIPDDLKPLFTPQEIQDMIDTALEDAKKQTVACLFDLKVIPKTMTDGYESWWNVGLADVSEKESVRKAWEGVKAGRDEARKY